MENDLLPPLTYNKIFRTRDFQVGIRSFERLSLLECRYPNDMYGFLPRVKDIEKLLCTSRIGNTGHL